ncbi:hypothetical protein N7468_007470 [Penicillium chermesinum]|uniref:Uncharacterized protein n=1 Tax=Penicillium chermesinum TaxID=63820 RepID=A0A9W9NU69_9EURO|nr:uncharacterized protein N7468_007470 [Penicillium chermesinum]KAJ5226245.1 hypothetical protein N7468_007470 [Penicillium chermesinum]
MFAPGQQQISKEEIKAGEIEAAQTIKLAVAGGILLYLCKIRPEKRAAIAIYVEHRANIFCLVAPFAIDFAKKFL